MMHNPVFESSMKRSMRSFRAPLLLTLYGLFMILVSLGTLTILQRGELSLGNLRAGLESHIYMSVMQFVLIILVAPALNAGSIAGERERQTLDLLLCTRTSSLSIVCGKLFSSFCFLALLIISSLPVMCVSLYFGGITIWDILIMMLFLLVTALTCCAVGIFCSSVFKRTVTATVVAYLIIFGVGAGTLLFPLLLQYGQLSSLTSSFTTYSSSYSAVVYSSTAAGGIGTGTNLGNVPKLLFLNPAVGIFSLLVEQTGLLQRSFSNLGYRGNSLYSVFELTGSFANVNMLVQLFCSAILTGAAAFFVKPTGRKAKKKK